MRTKMVIVLLAAILAGLLLIGCGGPRERPGEPGQPELVRLKIPESISRGQGEEPVLKVYIKKTGEVKEFPFEQYVAGVVAGEIKNDWPDEALAAQAILARTFVMEFVTDKGGSKYKGADVSTDIEEAQAWNEQAVNDKIRNAVNKTRGQVAVYNNRYIKSWFHSHAGGKTSTAKEGLAYEDEEPPYIKAVNSPDSDKAPRDDSNWKAVFSKQEVIKALNDTGKDITDFSSARVKVKGPSGRATVLSFNGVEVSAPEFRIAIGSTRMKSAFLTRLELKDDKLFMEGKGYGHGVGMSQWGAYALAEDGKKAAEIIGHYFKDVSIVRIWE